VSGFHTYPENTRLNVELLKKLQHLIIRKYGESSVIQKLPKSLKHLILIQGKLKSTKGIEQNIKLKTLSLSYFPKITDYTYLKELKNLEYLEFERCKRLEDLDFTAGMKNLKWIRIGNCDKIKSLNPLRKLKNLKGISIWGNTKILDDSVTFEDEKTEQCPIWRGQYVSISQRLYKEIK